MPRVQVADFDVHRPKAKKPSERTKLRPSKNIHIHIRPSHHASLTSYPNTAADTSASQTTSTKSKDCFKHEKSDLSFKCRDDSPTLIIDDPDAKSANIQDITKHRSAKRTRSRKRWNSRRICGAPIPWCLCLPILIALFLCAAALIITTSVLASLRSRSAETSTTMSTVTTTSATTSSTMSRTTTTATSTTSTTTTTTGITWLTTTNETAYPVWNTSVGRDSTPATVGTNVGNFYPGEIASYAFDNTTGTKYTNFGVCALSATLSSSCGLNTGIYVTPQRGPSSLFILQFCTANDLPDRDPFTITIEGSNQPSSSLTLGSSWALLYNGTTGLQTHTTRFECGPVLPVSNNSNWYSSYRVLVTSIRGNEVATQYSELRLMGYQ